MFSLSLKFIQYYLFNYSFYYLLPSPPMEDIILPLPCWSVMYTLFPNRPGSLLNSKTSYFYLSHHFDKYLPYMTFLT